MVRAAAAEPVGGAVGAAGKAEDAKAPWEELWQLLAAVAAAAATEGVGNMASG